MGRTLPGPIAAKIGQSNCFFVWLVELRLASGTKYFSKGITRTYNGHTWTPRLLGIDSLSAAYIDAKGKDFATPTFRFSNLADDGSSNFYFTALDSAESFVNREVHVHLYDVDSGTAVTDLWAGYLESPEYSSDGSEMTIGASFIWSVLDIQTPKLRVMRKCQYAFFNETWDGNDSIGCPYHTFGTAGFTSCAKSKQDCSARGMTRFYGGWTQVGLDPAKRGRDDIRKAVVPIVLGAGSFKIKPQISLVRIVGNELWVNFIISSVHSGLPFDPGDIDTSRVTIFGSTQAIATEVKYGAYPESLPANSDRFPDGLGHSLICHALAIFHLTNEQKENLDVEHLDLKIGLNNGRKIKSTGVPSGNPALQLRDFIQDKVNSLGLPDSAINTTIQAGTQAYVATRFQTRYVIKEQDRLIDIIQKMLGDFHGYITFDNAQLGIGCKRNDSTPVATFGTGGRMILNNYVKVYEKKEDELKNQVMLTYRDEKYRIQELLYYDKAAQQSAGNGIEKIIGEEFESLGLYDPGGDATQIAVNLAMYEREMLNGNLFIEFDVPLNDGLDVLPGDVIRVNNVRIQNNATNNYLFRVLPYKIDEANYKITLTCQLYKSVFYDYTADPIGADIIRTTDDTSSQGRAPDVTSPTLQIVPSGTNDADGKQLTIRGTFTVPAFNPSTEQSEGTFRLPPIEEVWLYWNYDDEASNQARLGAVRKVVQGTTAQTLFADFLVDNRKARTVITYFVSVGPNRGHAPLGYIPDRTRITTLSLNLSATGATASVASTVSNNGELIQIEREIVQQLSKTSNSINFVNISGVRTPLLDTASIAHSAGVEVAVAKLSYPFQTISLAAPRFGFSPVASLTATSEGDGVRFDWPHTGADNRETHLLYWSVLATALTDPALLGSANPAWYALDPLTPPAGVFLSINDDLQHKIRQAEIGGPNVIVRARVAARNGKNNYSSALSPSASASSSGSTVPDSAAPNNGTAITINRARLKSGGKLVVDFVTPTAQMNTWLKTVLIIHDNNATGTGRKFYDPLTSAWVSTYPDGSTELSLSKGVVEGLHIKPSEVFVGGRTQFYVRIGFYNQFNGGSVTYSPDLPGAGVGLITLSGSETDAQAQDTAAPGAVQGLQFSWNQRKGFFTEFSKPLTNISSLKGYWIWYKTGDGNFFLRAKQTQVVLSGTVSINKGSKIITGVGTAFISALGTTNVQVIVNGEYRGVKSIDSNTQIKVKSAFSTTATGVSITVVFKPMTLWPAGTTQAQAEIFIERSQHNTHSIAGDIITPATTTGVQAFVDAVNVVLGADTRGATASSNIAFVGGDSSGTRDATTLLDVAAQMDGTKTNFFDNFDMGFADIGSGNVCWQWKQYTGTNPAVFSDIRTSSSNMSWDKANSRLNWFSNTTKLTQLLGKIFKPGQTLTVTFWLQTNALIPPKIIQLQAKILEAGGVNVTSFLDDSLAAFVPIDASISGIYSLVSVQFRIRSTWDVTKDLYFSLETASTLSASSNIYLTRFMGTEGNSYLTAARKPGEVSPFTGLVTPDAGIVSLGIGPDLFASVGFRGGALEAGYGQEVEGTAGVIA